MASGFNNRPSELLGIIISHGGFFMVLIVYVTIIRILISIRSFNTAVSFYLALSLSSLIRQMHANVMFMPWALENFPQLTLKKAGPVTFWPVAYDIFTLKFKEKILFYWSLLSL